MKKLLAAVAALAMATPAMASTDGVLSDTSSTGTLDITATVAEMVSIRGLDDLTLNINAAAISGPSSHAAIAQSNFCVFSNVDAAGSYNISATGTPSGDSGNPFALAGATTGTNLNYVVHLSDEKLVNDNQVQPGQVLSYTNTAGGQTRATDLNCSNAGGENASVSVRVRDVVALAALADTYTGTLTVTVSVP